METYVNEYIDFLLKTKATSIAYANYSASHLRKLIKFFEEKELKDMTKVTRVHLDEFQQSIMQKTCASATKKSILSTVALFFRFLYDYGYIEENVGLVIETPRKEHKIPRSIMNEEEIKFLLTLPSCDDLMGLRDIYIMKLLYSSAMRPKEIFNLKLENIDLKRNQAIVRRPKNRRDHIVHFDRYTAYYLKKYIKNARPWLLHDKTSDYLFISAIGTDLSSSSWGTYFRNKYKPIMEKKFKKNITPYAFRHTSATHWLDSGARQKRDVLPYIQRQLGHESLESTAIYTHVAIEPLREIFKKYHPRELTLKNLHKIPSPEDIISPLEGEED